MTADRIEAYLQDHVEIFQRFLSNGGAEVVASVARLVLDCYRNGGKVVLFGNGGSAADALHIEGELANRFLDDRRPLPAIALGAGTPWLTAVANDYAYEEVFARGVQAHVRPGDVVFALSTSGRSANVLKGAKVARELGARVVAFTGIEGRELEALADLTLRVPSAITSHIQEVHIAAAHAVCMELERSLIERGHAS